MVSVVVVGPPMSGKTTLCSALAHMRDDTMPAFDETCSSYCYTIVANGREWHIWDTPSVLSPHDIDHNWAGEDTMREADVVVVCHDGHHGNPMPLVRECGVDRCIIALTRGPAAAADISYAVEYIMTSRSNGMLVPRASSHAELVACISAMVGDGVYCL